MTGSSTFPPQDDEAEGRLRPGPGRVGPRVLVVSLAVSAAIHLALVLLYPVLMARARPEAASAGERESTRPFRATRAVRLAEAPAEPEEEAPPPEEPEPEVTPAPEPPEEPTTFPEGGPPEGSAEEAPTAAERLRPGEADPRIWRPVSPERSELSDEERARLFLYGKLEALNDSLAAASELGPNLDWTYTDDEGRRWGISPGALHLGGLTIPIPSFWGGGAGAGNAQDALRRQWEWSDIEAGAARARVRETLDERAKAIRERKDRERKEKVDTTGGRGGRRGGARRF